MADRSPAADRPHGLLARRLLARGLLAFWGCWLLVVTASNVSNALAASGAVGRPAFASSNFELVESTTALYHPPRAVVWLLFLGVIAWEAAAAVLYLRAAAVVGRPGPAPPEAIAAAVAAGMGVFAAFMLADELCIAYALQATHMRALAAQGISFLVVRAALADG
jgi:hypothetical protein